MMPNPPSHLVYKARMCFEGARELGGAVITIVQPLRYELNNTLLYFLQPFGPNQLVRPETKHSIWQGRLWTLRHSMHVSVCLSWYV